MTRLEQLRERIASLPRRRAAADHVAVLGRRVETVRQIVDALREAASASAYSAKIFPESRGDRVSRLLIDAGRLAQWLDDKLQGVDDLDGKRVEERFIKLRDAGSAAARSVREAWVDQVSRVVATYSRIAAAADRARVLGGDHLANAVARMESRTEPPRSAEEVAAAQKDLALLAASVRALGLQGKAGEFLVNVADGVGDPLALIDPDVKDFIDKHQLWTSLRIVFR